MIINFKSSIDSDYLGNNPHIILSYTLKDIPVKLTVDGRRNLIAVVCYYVNFAKMIINIDMIFFS